MGRTVADLADEMTAVEFAYWRAFWQFDPWGEERADLRQAMTTSVLVNIHRAKGARPVPPTDFMPYFNQRPRRFDREAFRLKMRAAAARR